MSFKLQTELLSQSCATSRAEFPEQFKSKSFCLCVSRYLSLTCSVMHLDNLTTVVYLKEKKNKEISRVLLTGIYLTVSLSAVFIAGMMI